MRPLPSVLGGLTRKASITLEFSFMANVGVEKTQNERITSKGCPEDAFMELEKGTQISYMPSLTKVFFLFLK